MHIEKHSVVAALLAGLLGGCGQKGPLQPASPAASSVPAPVR